MSIDQVLEQVKKYPELWHNGHKQFWNRKYQQTIWIKIAKTLEADVVVVKKRWKHLKDQFRKEVKKLMLRQDENASSNWHLYEKMLFMNDDILKKNHERLETAADTSDDDEAPLAKQARHENVSCDILTDPNIGETNSFLQNYFNTNMKYENELRNDADYMFLVSLIPTIKQLNDIQKLTFRGKINDWLLHALHESVDNTEEIDSKEYIM